MNFPVTHRGNAERRADTTAVDAAVDATRWPDVASPPPSSRARTAVSQAVVRGALDRLPMHVRLADGSRLGRGGPLLRIHDPEAFYRRIGVNGLVGFGESYMAGEWDAPDLVAALSVLAGHAAELIPRPLQRLRGVWAPRQPAAQRNTPVGARDNISRHYDLSNELFALFLDASLSYSSAVFRGFPATWRHLEAAQHAKIDRLLDLAEVTSGTRLLEIGTGWGELAIRAARRGARVTTLTLSAEQRDLARERIRAAGAADRVSVELCDYREAQGTYDAVVSVEMVEAVGVEFWPVYFRTLDERLAPGGRAALQAITMPHDRMLASRGTFTWIHKYIFPGGQLPSVEAIEETVRDRTGLRTARRDGFGAHYAETLRLWRERFTERADEVAELGFDDTFRRMWTFYLAYSEAGFRAGYLDVQQYLFTKDGHRGGFGDRSPAGWWWTVNGFEWAAFAGNLAPAAGAALFVMAVTFAVALRTGLHRIVDVAWGVGFTAVALVSYVMSAGDGDPGRRLLVTVLTGVWGLRLALHIARRGRGHGEDPRYEALLARARGNRDLYALRVVYLLQGALVWLVSLPVQAAQYGTRPLSAFAVAGAALWAVGLFFEAVGDHQLARFKSDPAHRGRVMDRGLWSLTRHPNYFGDFCVWWGVFLVACDAGAAAAAVAVVSPLTMSFLLLRGSGKPLLERHMAERPGYAAYAARTSGFFPRPPKRGP